jgi:type I site-specific restriction endonuclease
VTIYNQKNALTSIEAPLMNVRRELLVAMATGAGKTFTTVSQVYRLLESRYARFNEEGTIASHIGSQPPPEEK